MAWCNTRVSSVLIVLLSYQRIFILLKLFYILIYIRMDPVQRFACLMVQSLTLEFNPSLFNDSSDSWRYDGVPQCNEK